MVNSYVSEDCVFSIIFGDDFESLDLMASSPEEANIWVTGINFLISSTKCMSFFFSLPHLSHLPHFHHILLFLLFVSSSIHSLLPFTFSICFIYPSYTLFINSVFKFLFSNLFIHSLSSSFFLFLTFMIKSSFHSSIFPSFLPWMNLLSYYSVAWLELSLRYKHEKKLLRLKFTIDRITFMTHLLF